MGIIKILSIDGGGIRGIIPALLLAEIEKRTQKSIAKLFDLIAGTSTGGILALGLTKANGNGEPAYSAEELVGLYEKNGKTIFPNSIKRKIESLWGLTEEQYPSDGLEKLLDDYFGEARLKDALTDVLITSYEIEKRFPFFFKSRNAKNMPAYDFSVKYIARATSAAPTYFEPLKLKAHPLDKTSDYYYLIDGGVYANNPTLCAYAEARKAYGPQADLLIVSLGTGELIRKVPYRKAKDWGLAGWAKPVLDIMMQGVSATVDYQMQQLLYPVNGENQYYRFQVKLTKGSDDLDDASSQNIHKLKDHARGLIRSEGKSLDRLCGQLA